MNWQKAILIIAVLIIALVTWMGRYDMTESGEHNVYRLDRWTGELKYISAAKSFNVDNQIGMSTEEITALISRKQPESKPILEQQGFPGGARLLDQIRAKNPRYKDLSDKAFVGLISNKTGVAFDEVAANLGYKEPEPSILDQLRAGNPAYDAYSDKDFIRAIANKIGISPEELEERIGYK